METLVKTPTISPTECKSKKQINRDITSANLSISDKPTSGHQWDYPFHTRNNSIYLFLRRSEHSCLPLKPLYIGYPLYAHSWMPLMNCLSSATALFLHFGRWPSQWQRAMCHHLELNSYGPRRMKTIKIWGGNEEHGGQLMNMGRLGSGVDLKDMKDKYWWVWKVQWNRWWMMKWAQWWTRWVGDMSSGFERIGGMHGHGKCGPWVIAWNGENDERNGVVCMAIVLATCSGWNWWRK